MIFRIFMILFALNMAAFWAKAHATEPGGLTPAVQVSRATQAATSRSVASFDQQQKLAELGLRLIRWEFGNDRHNPHYASQKVSLSPSISILPQGAALNLQFHF